eukprot:gb/GECH01010407.1/.p1 GENE.gb/GECH01010407.1/~~gb/GECH01010407.1/.p1  ORF type:complete len:210 (+),score=59.94 gb/GECH01010407.1/:1-630(+)
MSSEQNDDNPPDGQNDNSSGTKEDEKNQQNGRNHFLDYQQFRWQSLTTRFIALAIFLSVPNYFVSCREVCHTYNNSGQKKEGNPDALYLEHTMNSHMSASVDVYEKRIPSLREEEKQLIQEIENHENEIERIEDIALKYPDSPHAIDWNRRKRKLAEFQQQLQVKSLERSLLENKREAIYQTKNFRVEQLEEPKGLTYVVSWYFCACMV